MNEQNGHPRESDPANQSPPPYYTAPNPYVRPAQPAGAPPQSAAAPPHTPLVSGNPYLSPARRAQDAPLAATAPWPAPAQHPALPSARYHAGQLALAVVLTLTIYFLNLFIVPSLLDHVFSLVHLYDYVSGDTINELYVIFFYLVTYLPPALLYGRQVGYSLRQIPRERPHLPVLLSATGITLALSLVALFVTILLNLLWDTALPPSDFAPPATALALVLYLANSALLPAVIEELVYRGVVMGSLRRFGDGFALCVSALLFGLMHLNTFQFPLACMLGLVIGYFVIKTGSIYTGMFIHFVYNMLLTVATLVMWEMPSQLASLYDLLQSVLFIAGGVAGLVFLLGIRKVRIRLRRPPELPGVRRITCAFFLNLPMCAVLVCFIVSFWLYAV